MHDPLTVAFEIRSPRPRHARWRTEQAARTGVRWRVGRPFSVLAGRGLYWPSLITIWHRDPSGYDTTTCRTRRWRLHVHHWRAQVHPLQSLRRGLLTRCAWCKGRHTKSAPVCVSGQWDGPRGRWWQGEPGLFHAGCWAAQSAHATCVCTRPVLEHEGYGQCARCGRYRPFGITPEWIARARELSMIPRGSRPHGIGGAQ